MILVNEWNILCYGFINVDVFWYHVLYHILKHIIYLYIWYICYLACLGSQGQTDTQWLCKQTWIGKHTHNKTHIEYIQTIYIYACCRYMEDHVGTYIGVFVWILSYILHCFEERLAKKDLQKLHSKSGCRKKDYSHHECCSIFPMV